MPHRVVDRRIGASCSFVTLMHHLDPVVPFEVAIQHANYFAVITYALAALLEARIVQQLHMASGAHQVLPELER